MSGYTIIDVDTHVTETPDVWVSRVPEHMKDKVPRIENDAKGTPFWYLGDKRIGNPGMSATAGVGDMLNWPRSWEAMHQGAFNAHERLKYMDKMGIWAMVMYPNVGGFGSQAFLKMEDEEVKIACVQAYNDWQTEWASADSRRLLPITSIPFWDVEESVKEVRRCATKGHRGILFTGDPGSLGQPIMGDDSWNPLWEVAVELDQPISFHIGSGNMDGGLHRETVAKYGKMAAFAHLSIDIFLKNGIHLSDLLLSGVLARYPEIKFVSVESGIGWIPFVLEALDYQFQGNRVDEERPDLTMLPSEYFARNVYACYWFEKTAPRRLLDKVGVDKILFETDFPHPTSLYGEEVHDRIREGLGDCDAETQRKILWDNGLKLYKVEPPTEADEIKRVKVAAEQVL
ncbi:MAG: amidohydrolase [Pseudomonadales bacterium]|nr:amidohydrolase [Pseudomonadales bacterium]